MIIKVKQKGNYSKLSKYLNELKRDRRTEILKKYAVEGVSLLSSATPVDSGTTAMSWTYDIEETSNGSVINFRNTNINKGVPIAIILQYGHGTGTGGYVRGIDYINPPIQKLFNKMADEIWKEVSRL